MGFLSLRHKVERERGKKPHFISKSKTEHFQGHMSVEIRLYQPVWPHSSYCFHLNHVSTFLKDLIVLGLMDLFSCFIGFLNIFFKQAADMMYLTFTIWLDRFCFYFVSCII